MTKFIIIFEFFTREEGVMFELYNHYWPWNKEGKEVKYKLRERTREDRKVPRSNAKPKQKIKLTKLKRTQKVRDGGLKKIGYDPKVVEESGGIVE